MRGSARAWPLMLVLAACSQLGAQEFRVEIFSGHAMSVLNLRAASSEVQLCSPGQGHPCLELKPGEAGRCAAEAGAVRCTTPKDKRRWADVVVTSRRSYEVAPEFTAAPTDSNASRALPGELDLTATTSGLRVIARMSLEAYVSGVLAGEAGSMRSSAAREAMAIVARTWALRWSGRHRQQGFDFCSLTHCQAFHLPRSDLAKEDPPLDPAVRRTEGRVLEYQGKLIEPYFNANCGGMTEAAGDLWPDRAQPYLVSVRDPYCVAHEQSAWQRVLALESAGEVLRKDLPDPLQGDLIDLRIERRDASGRAQTLRAVGATVSVVDANAFRFALNRRLGWSTLKSNLYTLELRGGSLVFTGRGLGHGVGLCQAGTEQRARMGLKAEQILAAYFPGTSVVPLHGNDPVVSSEHFELAYPVSQQTWVNETLEALEHFRARLGPRAAALPWKVRVRTWETTEEFIRATGEPGWAAASTDGRRLSLQPLNLLARKRILEPTLRHELTHLLVHRLRADGIPRWFEEGLVLHLGGEQVAGGDKPSNDRRSLDEVLARPKNEAEMKWAYARCLARVQALARQRGEVGLWQMLEHPSAEDLRTIRNSK